MKRLICFLPFFAHGGAEKAALNLCNNLINTYDVTIILLNKKNLPLDQLSSKIKTISLNKKRLINSIFSLAYYIIKLKPKYLISFLYSANVISTISKLISINPVKLIFGVQNNFSQTIKNTSSIRTIFSLYLFRYATFFSTKIITCSLGLKNEIKEICFNKKQVYFVYNPIIDKDFFSRSSKFDKDISLFNGNYKNILSIGRFEKQKNFDFLLRSFKKLNINSDYKLFLIGKGSLETELKKLCRKLNIMSDVTFLGEKKNVNIFLKRCDYFVLTSNWEGFGNVLVEALYFDKKIISSNCKYGPSEILKNGKLGKLYKMNNFLDFKKQFKNFHNKKTILKRDLKNFYSSQVAKNYIKVIEK